MTIIPTKSNNVDSDSKSSTVNQAPKKRGRPLGAIRETYFILAAIVKGELVQEKIAVTRGEGITADEMRTEARKIFLKKHRVDAESEEGPVFMASLAQAASTKRPRKFRFSEKDLNYTLRKIQAEYNGWVVTGRYFEDEDGNENTEAVRIFFDKEISKGDKPRAKPQPTVKYLDELENVQELPSAHS